MRGPVSSFSGARYSFKSNPRPISQIKHLQDLEMGGIADRPGDMVDVYHTVFGLAGLSLLGFPGLVEVSPV